MVEVATMTMREMIMAAACLGPICNIYFLFFFRGGWKGGFVCLRGVLLGRPLHYT